MKIQDINIYEYQFNIQINNKLGYKYIRIFINSLQIYSNICKFIMNTIEYLNCDHYCYVSKCHYCSMLNYLGLHGNQIKSGFYAKLNSPPDLSYM